MKNFLLTILLLSGFNLFSQDRPAILPEDVESRSLTLDRFTRPGVINKSRSRGIEISFVQVNGSQLIAEDSPIDPEAEIGKIQQLNFKVKAPIINKESFRMLLGYSYLPEQYNFNTVGTAFAPVFNHLDGRWLKSQQASLFVNKPLNEKQYLTFRVKMAYNGDYEKFIDFSSNYRIFTATGLFGIKKSENMEWGLGLNFTNSFRSTIVLPFVLYNKNFNEKFGVEIVLPVLILGRWNIKEGTLLIFGAEYSSRSYAIDVPDQTGSINYDMNHSEIRFPLRLEQKIRSWVWVGGQIGYQYNFSTDFDATADSAFKVEPKSSPYFKIGLFISPPDDFK